MIGVVSEGEEQVQSFVLMLMIVISDASNAGRARNEHHMVESGCFEHKDARDAVQNACWRMLQAVAEAAATPAQLPPCDIASCDNVGTISASSRSSTSIATIFDLPPPILSPHSRSFVAYLHV